MRPSIRCCSRRLFEAGSLQQGCMWLVIFHFSYLHYYNNNFVSETATKTGMIILLGEISSTAIIDYQTIVRDTIKQIGYDDSRKGM